MIAKDGSETYRAPVKGLPIRVGMDVYDRHERYIGTVTRVYPVPEPFAHGATDFGCFKVRRGPWPFFGPRPLLVPFEAIRAIDEDRLTLVVAASREEAEGWTTGQQG